MADEKLELAIQIRADIQRAAADIRKMATEIGSLGQAGRQGSNGLEQINRAGLDAANSIRRTLDPTRRLHAQIVEIRRLSARGLISPSTANAGVANLRAQIAAMGTAAQGTGRRLTTLTNHASRATRAFTDLRRAVLLAFVGHELIDFTRSIVDANVEFQRIIFTLRAVTGSTAAAQAEFAFLRDTSQKLGLDLKETAAGYSRLAVSAKSAGLTTQQMHTAFKGLAETFTVLHTPAADVNGLLVQLEQGLSLGKFQMQDFRAIAQHLPGTLEVAKEAAHAMGGSLKDMLAHGGVPAMQFFVEFARLLHDKFGPEATEAAHSLNAELNRLHTTIFGLETGPQTTFVSSFTVAVRNLNTELNKPDIQQGLANLISDLGKAMQLAVKAATAVDTFGRAIGLLAAQATGRPDPNDRLATINFQIDNLKQKINGLKNSLGDTNPVNRFFRSVSQSTGIGNLGDTIDSDRAKLKQYQATLALLEETRAKIRNGQLQLAPSTITPPTLPATSPASAGHTGATLGGSAGSGGETNTAAAKLVADLQTQAATFGLTARQALAYRLDLNKATAAQRAAALAAFDVKAGLQQIQQAGEQAAKIRGIEAQAALQHALAGVALKRETLAQKLALGEISGAEELRRLADLENRKYAIERKGLQDRLALEKVDAAKRAQLKAKLQQLEDQHALKTRQLNDRTTRAVAKTWESRFNVATDAIQQSINGVIQGTQTWRQATANLLNSIVAEGISAGLKMLAHWGAVEIAKTTATATGAASRTAIRTGEAATETGLTIGTAIKSILAHAWEAASAVYASIAAIPGVGPFLAPAMAIAAGATVAGYVGRIASAANGYDIPAGVNPIVQTHEEEMILPADLSNKVRNMTDGGGTQIHIHAVDAKSVKRLFMDHPDALAEAVLHARRRGAFAS